MITGYPTIQGAVECIKLGALDYLVKPFRIDELETVVQKARDNLEQRARKEPGEAEEAGRGASISSSARARPCKRCSPRSGGPRPATAPCS